MVSGYCASCPFLLSWRRASWTGQVQSCLEKAYDRLLACYFNVSSKKQREDEKNWNFYYDTQADHWMVRESMAGGGLGCGLEGQGAHGSLRAT